MSSSSTTHRQRDAVVGPSPIGPSLASSSTSSRPYPTSLRPSRFFPRSARPTTSLQVTRVNGSSVPSSSSTLNRVGTTELFRNSTPASNPFDRLDEKGFDDFVQDVTERIKRALTGPRPPSVESQEQHEVGDVFGPVEGLQEPTTLRVSVSIEHDVETRGRSPEHDHPSTRPLFRPESTEEVDSSIERPQIDDDDEDDDDDDDDDDEDDDSASQDASGEDDDEEGEVEVIELSSSSDEEEGLYEDEEVSDGRSYDDQDEEDDEEDEEDEDNEMGRMPRPSQLAPPTLSRRDQSEREVDIEEEEDDELEGDEEDEEEGEDDDEGDLPKPFGARTAPQAPEQEHEEDDDEWFGENAEVDEEDDEFDGMEDEESFDDERAPTSKTMEAVFGGFKNARSGDVWDSMIKAPSLLVEDPEQDDDEEEETLGTRIPSHLKGKGRAPTPSTPSSPSDSDTGSTANPDNDDDDDDDESIFGLDVDALPSMSLDQLTRLMITLQGMAESAKRQGDDETALWIEDKFQSVVEAFEDKGGTFDQSDDDDREIDRGHFDADEETAEEEEEDEDEEEEGSEEERIGQLATSLVDAHARGAREGLRIDSKFEVKKILSDEERLPGAQVDLSDRGEAEGEGGEQKDEDDLDEFERALASRYYRPPTPDGDEDEDEVEGEEEQEQEGPVETNWLESMLQAQAAQIQEASTLEFAAPRRPAATRRDEMEEERDDDEAEEEDEEDHVFAPVDLTTSSPPPSDLEGNEDEAGLEAPPTPQRDEQKDEQEDEMMEEDETVPMTPEPMKRPEVYTEDQVIELGDTSDEDEEDAQERDEDAEMEDDDEEQPNASSYDLVPPVFAPPPPRVRNVIEPGQWDPSSPIRFDTTNAAMAEPATLSSTTVSTEPIVSFSQAELNEAIRSALAVPAESLEEQFGLAPTPVPTSAPLGSNGIPKDDELTTLPQEQFSGLGDFWAQLGMELPPPILEEESSVQEQEAVVEEQENSVQEPTLKLPTLSTETPMAESVESDAAEGALDAATSLSFDTAPATAADSLVDPSAIASTDFAIPAYIAPEVDPTNVDAAFPVGEDTAIAEEQIVVSAAAFSSSQVAVDDVAQQVEVDAADEPSTPPAPTAGPSNTTAAAPPFVTPARPLSTGLLTPDPDGHDRMPSSPDEVLEEEDENEDYDDVDDTKVGREDDDEIVIEEDQFELEVISIVEQQVDVEDDDASAEASSIIVDVTSAHDLPTIENGSDSEYEERVLEHFIVIHDDDAVMPTLSANISVMSEDERSIMSEDEQSVDVDDALAAILAEEAEAVASMAVEEDDAAPTLEDLQREEGTTTPLNEPPRVTLFPPTAKAKGDVERSTTPQDEPFEEFSASVDDEDEGFVTEEQTTITTTRSSFVAELPFGPAQNEFEGAEALIRSTTPDYEPFTTTPEAEPFDPDDKADGVDVLYDGDVGEQANANGDLEEDPSPEDDDKTEDKEDEFDLDAPLPTIDDPWPIPKAVEPVASPIDEETTSSEASYDSDSQASEAIEEMLLSEADPPGMEQEEDDETGSMHVHFESPILQQDEYDLERHEIGRKDDDDEVEANERHVLGPEAVVDVDLDIAEPEANDDDEDDEGDIEDQVALVPIPIDVYARVEENPDPDEPVMTTKRRRSTRSKSPIKRARTATPEREATQSPRRISARLHPDMLVLPADLLIPIVQTEPTPAPAPEHKVEAGSEAAPKRSGRSLRRSASAATLKESTSTPAELPGPVTETSTPRRSTRHSSTPAATAITSSKKRPRSDAADAEREQSNGSTETSSTTPKRRRGTSAPSTDTPLASNVPLPRLHHHSSGLSQIGSFSQMAVDPPVTRAHCPFVQLEIQSKEYPSAPPVVVNVPSCALSSPLAQETLASFPTRQLGQHIHTPEEASVQLGRGVASTTDDEVVESGLTHRSIEERDAEMVPYLDVLDALKKIVGVEMWHEGVVELVSGGGRKSGRLERQGEAQEEGEQGEGESRGVAEETSAAKDESKEETKRLTRSSGRSK